MRTALLFLFPALALALGFLLGRGVHVDSTGEDRAGPGPTALGPGPSPSAEPVRHAAALGTGADSAPEEPAPQEGHRVAVHATDSGEVEAASDAVPPPEELRAALEEFLASGLLEKQYAGDPHGLASFLANQYLAAGRPFDAWEIYRVWPDLGADLIGEVGQLLASQGQVGGATEALLEAARLDPYSEEWTNDLLGLDPLGALAVLRQAMRSDPDLAMDGGTYREVLLLLETDQTQEALERLDELLAAEVVDPYVYELLRELPPDIAEERLRAQAAGDTYGEARMRLAELLMERGDEEGAIEVLGQVVQDAPGHWEALWQLGELDREACIAILRERASDPDADAETWGALGEQLDAAGRREEAIEAWLAAFELYPSNGEYCYQLLEAAPERFWPMIEEHTRRSGDDELWGDLADAYWRAGRSADAKDAWTRARHLDPNDGEWSGKLNSLASGVDPLGDGGGPISSMGWQDLGDLGYVEAMYLGG